ncbi:hypothetical protein PIB30_079096 [Stylosanthes scabra]|uniref:Uncharacterized protein n=1 Tax=Stylosanthes scabra TaxID=79078 RepID=A0ABU6QRH7_9FABA|nr:hypothetical protein [Stylosanthes scabra]
MESESARRNATRTMKRPPKLKPEAPRNNKISVSTEEDINGGNNKNNVEEEGIRSSNNGWCTPKGKRFRIPEILTCPPPPKKMKSVIPNKFSSSSKSSIALFAATASPEEIELFFFTALKNVVSST